MPISLDLSAPPTGLTGWPAGALLSEELVRRMGEWSFAVRARLLADPTEVPPRRWADRLG